MTIMLKVRDFCERRNPRLLKDIAELERQPQSKTRDRQIAGLRRQVIDSSYKLRLACDLKSPTTANQIWKNEMLKIGFDTIEALCRGLECEPSDLFRFDPPLKIKRG